MLQVLFHIPFTARLMPPDGVPIYGFGVMLFFCFLLTTMVWGPRRAARVGLAPTRLQDLGIVLFVFGLAGARVVYMLQYPEQFPADWPGRLAAFLQIWNGGIVVYGAVFGGLIGYGLFYHFVLRKLNVSGWQLADAVAPLIALGLAVGRLGCYLNGCCWGQPVCVDCQPVPLSPSLGAFPLLPAHARDQVCLPPKSDARRPEIHGLQTSAGFAIAPSPALGQGDPRTLVLALEPGSAAEAAGLQPGDRVVELNHRPNEIVVEGVQLAAAQPRPAAPDGTPRCAFPTPEAYQAAALALLAARTDTLLIVADDLAVLVRDANRGRGELTLGVLRAGAIVPITFTPRTVPFFPTQLYETLSMVLLIGVLLTFQPLRRHDGQVMVLLMLGYAAHRFVNEALRIEPTYALGLTLSQWISLGIALAAVGLELYLRGVRPKLGAGLQPLGTAAANPGRVVTAGVSRV